VRRHAGPVHDTTVHGLRPTVNGRAPPAVEKPSAAVAGT
jgi:hypothetical protein